MLPDLTLPTLKAEVRLFAKTLSSQPILTLYGVTDGKAVGTYVEHAFKSHLFERYAVTSGNAASGLDFPSLNVDLKVTSIRQPQSSSPFREAGQKVYGLGYHLLIIAYDKIDDHALKTARLDVKHSIFVASEQTGDYQTTLGLARLRENLPTKRRSRHSCWKETCR